LGNGRSHLPRHTHLSSYILYLHICSTQTRPTSRQRSCVVCNTSRRSITGRMGSETPADRVPFRPTRNPSLAVRIPVSWRLDFDGFETTRRHCQNLSAWRAPLTMPFAALLLQFIAPDHTVLDSIKIECRGNAIGLFSFRRTLPYVKGQTGPLGVDSIIR
jgi:hypothetical protein